ncbi:hypothetical protein PILCRDRAFT_822816 [Piloderma croceum F 1598]|uniref:Cytochrome P450 n=1 Tax=Piloderma croceum (strain F 1598) TaxID=765440 RepID=A0A0C3B159_PILCF|nr:hypothetical protein PILCRDRAFT_822816 [Piloderma croceum F 1598]
MLNAASSSRLPWFESLFTWMPWDFNVALPAPVTGLLLVLGTLYARSVYSGNDTSKIYQLGGFSIVNAWTFFNKRYDFLRSNFDKTGHELFAFKVLHYQVVAMSGEDARKTFFNEKRLSFAKGYQLFMGGNPDLKDIKMEAEIEESIELGAFIKRLLKIFRKDRLQDVMPTMFADINGRMEILGAEGKINPFKDIYDLVFQLTVRMTTCEELATDLRMIERMNDLYWKLEKSSTPASLLLPWFPSTARKDKDEATKSLYDILSHYVDLRRKAEEPNSDAIDLLIADGADNVTIVSFVLNIIFAGTVNTGMLASWTLVQLGVNNEWKNKAIAEIQNLLTTYPTNSHDPIHQRLSAIPMTAWEDEMPIIECVTRETLRTIGNGTALRRNLVDDLQVGGKTIDKGAFMAYNLGDVHMNHKYYPDPHKFDPNRFNTAEENSHQGNVPFLGWGTGRHPCAGIKVAKFEIKIILALFLSCYEYELVDPSGKPLKRSPQPDRNDIQKNRPIGEPCFLQYRRTKE